MKSCVIIISDSTKRALSDFKYKNEDIILKSTKKPRRFVSWDDAIMYLIGGAQK